LHGRGGDKGQDFLLWLNVLVQSNDPFGEIQGLFWWILMIVRPMHVNELFLFVYVSDGKIHGNHKGCWDWVGKDTSVHNMLFCTRQRPPKKERFAHKLLSLSSLTLWSPHITYILWPMAKIKNRSFNLFLLLCGCKFILTTKHINIILFL
jgi:hypothetical protein